RHNPPSPQPFPYTTLFRSQRVNHMPSLRTEQNADSCESPNSQEQRIKRNKHPRRHVTKNGASIKVEKPSADSGNGAITLRSRSRSEEHTSELQSREKLVCR